MDKTQAKAKTFLIAGPSGVGKGTVIKRILTIYKKVMEKPVSYTTRDPRDGEINGEHYHFITKGQFESKKGAGEFMEYVTPYGGHYYGTTIQSVNQIRSKGKVCVLQMHVESGIKLHQQGYDYTFIFMNPPSLEELQQRLRGRAESTGEIQQKILQRMDKAQSEIDEAASRDYYHKVVNHNVDETIARILSIVYQQ